MSQPQYVPHQHNRTLSLEAELTRQQALDQLAANLRGRLILPNDPDYETERRVWNAGIDRHPAMIVRAADAEDVRTVVNSAREQGMPLAIRSGGHSVPGHSTIDDGVLLDLSNMKRITVDPVGRTARIEPGLTWGEVAQTLHPFGLAITSGNVASVGVGGLLLGGGIGWMARSEGLTIDHLRAVELVNADGQLVRASVDEHPDLFWGVRGGGGNFGVATAFELDLHRGGTVLGGAVFYEATEAERILNEYVRIAATAPDELTTDISFMLAPPVPFIPAEKHGTPVAAVMLVYNGDPAKGEQVVAPLRELATPLADTIAPMPYPDIFSLVAVGEVREWQHHGRGQFFKQMRDDMLHALVDAAQAVMSPATIINLRVLGGAMSRVARDATAFAHRDAHGMVLVTHFGPPTLDPADLHARSQHVFAALAPYASGAYVNFLSDEGEDRIREAYPSPTYERLAALKRRYDPTNVFRGNQNIKPTA